MRVDQGFPKWPLGGHDRNLGGYKQQRAIKSQFKLTLAIMELIIKSKKKVFGVFTGSYINNLVGEDHSFL